MSRTAIWYLIHGIGVKAGVPNLSPRLLRHYFACKWIADMRKPGSTKSMVGLQRCLRHKRIGTVSFYTSRLVFFEDVQEEFNGVKNPYFPVQHNNANPTVNNAPHNRFYEEYCNQCIHESTCKFKDEMCSCEAASGCRFYKQKKEVII